MRDKRGHPETLQAFLALADGHSYVPFSKKLLCGHPQDLILYVAQRVVLP